MKAPIRPRTTRRPAGRPQAVVAALAGGTAGEHSLGELRRSRGVTQGRLARDLGVGQDNVSRLEQRGDLLVSTLRAYVEALGGRLTLVAEFPGGSPVAVDPGAPGRRLTPGRTPPVARRAVVDAPAAAVPTPAARDGWRSW